MELGFLLSLIVFLGGLWIYLHKTIRDLSLADPTALFLGFMHFIVLMYLVLALFVFYCRGVGTAQALNAGRGPVTATAILLTTWPIVVLCLVFSFLLAKVSESDFAVKSPLWVFFIAGILTVMYQPFAQRHGYPGVPLSPQYILVFFTVIVFGAVVYILLLSFFLAEVEITTDKEFYTDKDVVIISIRAAGYVFRPEIAHVSLGAYQQAISYDRTIALGPEQHNGQEQVEVEYVPQVIPIKRKAYHNIKMAKTSNS